MTDSLTVNDTTLTLKIPADDHTIVNGDVQTDSNKHCRTNDSSSNNDNGSNLPDIDMILQSISKKKMGSYSMSASFNNLGLSSLISATNQLIDNSSKSIHASNDIHRRPFDKTTLKQQDIVQNVTPITYVSVKDYDAYLQHSHQSLDSPTTRNSPKSRGSPSSRNVPPSSVGIPTSPIRPLSMPSDRYHPITPKCDINTRNSHNVQQQVNYLKPSSVKTYILGLLTDPMKASERDEVLKSSGFINIFQRQLNDSTVISRELCANTIIRIQQLLNGSANVDDFSLQCICLAYEELHRVTQVNDKLHKTICTTEVEKNKLVNDKIEMEYDIRVKSANAIKKSFQALKKISAKRDETRKLQQERKEKKQQRQLSSKLNEEYDRKISTSHANHELHRRRADEIVSMKEKGLADAYDRNEKKYQELMHKRDEDTMKNMELALLKKDSKGTQRMKVAAKAEEDFIERAYTTMKMKDDKFELRYNEYIEQQREYYVKQNNKHNLLEYKAEHNRKMIEVEKQAKIKMMSKRREKSDTYHHINTIIADDRPTALHRIKEKLIESNNQERSKSSIGGTVPDSSALNQTPGPGDYDPKCQNTVRGGYMASSRVAVRPKSTPSPLDYYVDSNKSSQNSIKGTLPFTIRGKTDVDCTLLVASKLPGVGAYNISTSLKPDKRGNLNLRGSIPFQGKGISDLDYRILAASKSPGPGTYNLCSPISSSKSPYAPLVHDIERRMDLSNI